MARPKLFEPDVVKVDAPTPAQIVEGRKACGISQASAAALVHSARRTWQQWEAGEHEMHPGLWELFLIKSAALPGG